MILAGRRINDGMGKYVAEQTVKQMIQNGGSVKGAAVNVLGLTFKENCPDLRNSRVVDVIEELRSYGVQVHVHDPVADAGEAKHEYGIELKEWQAGGAGPRLEGLAALAVPSETRQRVGQGSTVQRPRPPAAIAAFLPDCGDENHAHRHPPRRRHPAREAAPGARQRFAPFSIPSATKNASVGESFSIDHG